MTEPAGSPASLVAGVLDEEQRRQTAQAADAGREVLPVDGMLALDAASVPLRAAVREGGVSLLLVVGVLGLTQTLEIGAFGVLAPDIQQTLDISDTAIGVIGGMFAVLFVLGSLPLSSLADRAPRKLIAGVAMAFWTVIVTATAFVGSAAALVVARVAGGLSQSYYLPVADPMLADGYPGGGRSKVFAAKASFQLAGHVLGPLLAGVILLAVGGDEEWRWMFAALGCLGVAATIAVFSLREPRRGRYEMQAVLGAELFVDQHDELPISMGVAFERLRRIRTFSYYLAGLAAVGFAVFGASVFMNLYLDEEFGLSPFRRGLFFALAVVPGFAGAALAGRRFDEVFRASPPRASAYIGALVAGFGVLQVIGLHMPSVWTFGIFLGLSSACLWAVFATLPAIIVTVVPYRLRSRGSALMGIYLVVFGAFLGAVLTGLLSDSRGEQAALTIVLLPATLVGGALIAAGGRFLRSDLSLVVEDLFEEQTEDERVSRGDATPVLQARNLDFSYGKVQVLFDVGFEVHKGESLALLGSNGAGKSTLLRVIAGLGVPQRGVVRMNGRTITYVDPETRARLGIVNLAGGRALFPGLSVGDNLRMAGFRYARAECDTRVDRVFAMFPILADRRNARARELSGGQQQMLALAMALMHDPEVLIIDELSLGLAPVAVQELLRVIDRLRSEGMTMIIVEQSLNIALSITDRAIFLEKGEVRFEGSTRELLEREDLAQSVLLGQTGAPT